MPFIGAPQVWSNFGVRGQGMRVAIVDTGIDYTHASFGGEGTVAAYEANDPTFIEPGSFPTDKVIGGFDFVGEQLRRAGRRHVQRHPAARLRPAGLGRPRDAHRQHRRRHQRARTGRAGAWHPTALLYAYKVWDEGNSTDDVLVAAYERAMDPNQDGNVADAVDVLSFSGGVDYGTLNSLEAKAAQRVVDLGTVFVASAGNSGNQAAGGSAYISGTPVDRARRRSPSRPRSTSSSRSQLTINSSTDGTIRRRCPTTGTTVHQSWSPLPPEGSRPTCSTAGRSRRTPTASQFCDPLPADSLDRPDRPGPADGDAAPAR